MTSPDPSADRRTFLRRLGSAAAALAAGAVGTPTLAHAAARLASEGDGTDGMVPTSTPALVRGEFQFARLRYSSGDWDYNPKVCANVLDTLLQYTTVPVREQEVVIAADSQELAAFPFVFMTGHKLVRFTEQEREGLRRFVDAGGVLVSDDCNHDVNGLYATTFEAEMLKVFGTPGAMPKLPNSHPLYSAFFRFPFGPPQTSHELNGWGDNIVHEYLRGVTHHNRLGVIYTNKDYGCEWDYDWRNKRFRSRDNTKFAANLVVYAMT
jgi:hypothetical protein